MVFHRKQFSCLFGTSDMLASSGRNYQKHVPFTLYINIFTHALLLFSANIKGDV